MKKHILLASLLSCLFLMTACFQKDKTDYVKLGYEQLNNANYIEASNNFKMALENNQDAIMAYRGLGICHMFFGEYAEAVDAFKMALHSSDSSPDDVDFDINYYLGVCYSKLGDHESAKERYDAILDLRPREVDAYMQRGAEYLYLRDSDRACADFEKAFSLRKKDYSLYIDAYNLLSESGFESIGIEYLNEVLEKEDRNLSEYDKGYIYYCLGNYSTAKNYLEQARSDSSNKKKGSETLLLLGRCYEELNDTAFAVNLYQTYLTNNPDAKVYNQLCVALVKEGKYEEALDAVINGIELDSNDCRQQLLFNRIVVYEYLGDFDKARDLAVQYLVDFPSDETMAREYNFLKTR